jgi:adhesin/invasin
VATATWTLGDTARVYTLTAAITGASVTLQATAGAGDATVFTKVSPDTLVVAAGASTLITARAVDKFGNPVPGVVVAWTTTGGALTAATTTTGASGNAEVAFSSDPSPRSYTITATAAGLGATTFTVVGQ